MKKCLLEAIKNGHKKIVVYLIGQELKPTMKALKLAAHVDNPEIVWILLGQHNNDLVDECVLTKAGYTSNVFFYPGFQEKY